ncbi:MAG: M20/M25/M40 family metallo-hydrolase [Candidatus Marinimicrobia bacterium]|jgi:acetylornithine deacetylase/succinyl-diaminopimelate desuccinylase-like protein|nr:M20/M25/M40 family metallo-hydrolase [Candidatus Neomarinimicrobiota bacterium]MBT5748564.1 M20/M25/M40 family metallo-hydrolase [Candidatus Neomarinimicrobiota bacterium]MBT6413781.1 M20/M25/M40 family metallo-hydrolase [Candidatus Neomarinimicrobiota bacterium]MBT7271046.1 M20/M25/M40 family metallo-hydrolase [Candidatus Neomarinimicrobiota bacterium]MBT7514573.1 M20/M25/M40 family metallo-hydrolase [Candidatus Neomarinimicrobiota bacterium]
MNNTQLQNTINTFWDENIIPPLIDYIKIPNKSPSFDSEWKSNGHMDRVLVLASEWAKTHLPENATLTVKETDGRTPLILVDIPGDRDGNILMYGHLDKQPEMEGWNDGLGPWTPVIKDEKLYGRGGADDGYALFASLCAVKALKEQSATLPRILILIEFCEESGSPDLPYYMNLCADVIGTPDLVVCLDSGAGDYKRFWTTTSLRGMIGGTLRVDVLTEGVHSGGASGHVPSSFRIARQLLSRLEDQNTGEILLDELKTQIPDYRIKETEKFVSILGNEVIDEFPWADTMQPSTENNVEGVLRRSWRPALSVVGADGLPPSNNAGNVLRPYTQLQLSMRIPPMVNPIEAQNAIEKVLIENPPYNASISVHFEEAASGWNAPETAEWLALAMNRASEEFYGESSCSLSEGGTIPFMAMLGDQFPRAQFVITGVLGPGSNAHGPNEFLHVPYAKKLTACVAFILNNFPK